MAVAAKREGRPTERAVAAPAKQRAPGKGTEPRLLSPSEELLEDVDAIAHTDGRGDPLEHGHCVLIG